MEQRTFIATGNARTVLSMMPRGIAYASISSPSYWRQRDYGVKGQLGQEETVAEYIENLCAVYDEVWNVLRDDGTCWVNLGDTYINNVSRLGKAGNGKQTTYRAGRMTTDVPHKSLALIPFRFAIAMQDRGWIIRNVIIWHKPNCIPSSATDRFTVDFEYLFFFSKRPRYYFQQQTEPIKESSIARLLRNQSKHHKLYEGAPGQKPHSLHKGHDAYQNGTRPLPICRNKRCVWCIPTANCHEAHFAVFPEELIETPILAACPEYGYVLDPFLGSGTTAIVCERLNRSCIGIELNPAFAALAKKRIKNAWRYEKEAVSPKRASSRQVSVRLPAIERDARLTPNICTQRLDLVRLVAVDGPLLLEPEPRKRIMRLLNNYRRWNLEKPLVMLGVHNDDERNAADVFQAEATDLATFNVVRQGRHNERLKNAVALYWQHIDQNARDHHLNRGILHLARRGGNRQPRFIDRFTEGKGTTCNAWTPDGGFIQAGVAMGHCPVGCTVCYMQAAYREAMTVYLNLEDLESELGRWCGHPHPVNFSAKSGFMEYDQWFCGDDGEGSPVQFVIDACVRAQVMPYILTKIAFPRYLKFHGNVHLGVSLMPEAIRREIAPFGSPTEELLESLAWAMSEGAASAGIRLFVMSQFLDQYVPLLKLCRDSLGHRAGGLRHIGQYGMTGRLRFALLAEERQGHGNRGHSGVPIVSQKMSAKIQHHFANITDPRRRKVTFPLINIVVIAVCAVICGADDFVAIADFGKLKRKWFTRFLDLKGGIPSHDRFNSVLARIKPAEFGNVCSVGSRRCTKSPTGK